MKPKSVKNAVLGGLLMALIALATAFLAFPIPGVTGAYVNAGDGCVFAAAYYLPGVLGAVVAGIGSALADAMLGSLIYLPATLVIKGLMAFAAGKLFRIFKKKWGIVIAMLLSGLIMPAGYFIYECALYGAPIAVLSIPFNLLQYAAGVILGVLIVKGMDFIFSRKTNHHN